MTDQAGAHTPEHVAWGLWNPHTGKLGHRLYQREYTAKVGAAYQSTRRTTWIAVPLFLESSAPAMAEELERLKKQYEERTKLLDACFDLQLKQNIEIGRLNALNAKLVEALNEIANIERGWNKPHRVSVARQMVDDCVIAARRALGREAFDGLLARIKQELPE
jgi:hypothetical protein